MERQKHTCWSCAAIYVDIGRVPLSCPRCSSLADEKSVTFPVGFLRDVRWSFMEPAAASRAAFRKKLLSYNQELGCPIADEAAALDVALNTWRVRVVFIYRGDDADARIEDQAPLSALAILHALHQSWGRKLAKVDHHFFEGLSLLRRPRGSEPPVYSMHLGS